MRHEGGGGILRQPPLHLPTMGNGSWGCKGGEELTCASSTAPPACPEPAMRAAATHRAHLCRGCAGSRRRGGVRGALRGSEVLGGLRGDPDPKRPPHRAPTFHQQTHGAQCVTPLVAAVPPGVFRPQPLQQQLVAPPQRPPPPGPQHGAVGRLRIPAQQRHVGSGAAQHRVLRQRWGAMRKEGGEKSDGAPKAPGVPEAPRRSPSICPPKASLKCS